MYGCCITENGLYLRLLIFIQRIRSEEFKRCGVIPFDVLLDDINIDELVGIIVGFINIASPCFVSFITSTTRN